MVVTVVVDDDVDELEEEVVWSCLRFDIFDSEIPFHLILSHRSPSI